MRMPRQPHCSRNHVCEPLHGSFAPTSTKNPFGLRPKNSHTSSLSLGCGFIGYSDTDLVRGRTGSYRNGWFPRGARSYEPGGLGPTWGGWDETRLRGHTQTCEADP